LDYGWINQQIKVVTTTIENMKQQTAAIAENITNIKQTVN